MPTSLDVVRLLGAPRLQRDVEANVVYVLQDKRKHAYAMIIPTNFMLLLEVRDVLKDRNKYQIVPEAAAVMKGVPR
jgi:hypothetical protein